MLLGQTQASAADAIEGQVLEDETVRQHVVRSDKRRERLLLEAHDLSAIDNGFDSIAVVQAYRKVCHRRLEDELFEANALALRRSGARGSEARKALLDVEARMVISQLKLVFVTIFYLSQHPVSRRLHSTSYIPCCRLKAGYFHTNKRTDTVLPGLIKTRRKSL